MSTPVSQPADRKAEDSGALTWLAKSSAGILLGFTLAVALAACFGLFAPGPLRLYNGKHQLTMWLTGFLWALILAGVFLFRDGRRAWLWLGAANLVGYAGLGLWWMTKP